MQARWREYMRPTSTSPLADTLVLAGAAIAVTVCHVWWVKEVSKQVVRPATLLTHHSTVLNLKSSPSLTPGRRAQVRARLGAALADTVTQADAAAWAAFDVAALLRVAARLVGDNTPEAREAGRRLVGAAHDAFRTGRLGAAGAAAAGGAPGDGSDVRRARDGAQARARALAAPWPRARARAPLVSAGLRSWVPGRRRAPPSRARRTAQRTGRRAPTRRRAPARQPRARPTRTAHGRAFAARGWTPRPWRPCCAPAAAQSRDLWRRARPAHQVRPRVHRCAGASNGWESHVEDAGGERGCIQVTFVCSQAWVCFRTCRHARVSAVCHAALGCRRRYNGRMQRERHTSSRLA